ncbi:TPA: hypothetical protein PC598_003112 [Morganella morganii]|nr:hypothetical protein [Morganella morganii]
MIHATIHKKSSRWFAKSDSKAITLSHETEKRIPREDEVTSSIFGSMRYLNSNAIYRLFMALCREPIIHESCISHKIDLWPRMTDVLFQKEKYTVEPDAVLYFQFEKGITEKFILEIKWLDYRYGEAQLEKEWLAFGENECGDTRLLYIATDISSFDTDKKHKNKQWRAVSWNEFHKVLSNMTGSKSEESTILFFQDVAKMLDMFNKEPFYGFDGINFQHNLNEININLINFDLNIPIFNVGDIF